LARSADTAGSNTTAYRLRRCDPRWCSRGRRDIRSQLSISMSLSKPVYAVFQDIGYFVRCVSHRTLHSATVTGLDLRLGSAIPWLIIFPSPMAALGVVRLDPDAFQSTQIRSMLFPRPLQLLCSWYLADYKSLIDFSWNGFRIDAHRMRVILLLFFLSNQSLFLVMSKFVVHRAFHFMNQFHRFHVEWIPNWHASNRMQLHCALLSN
jgi:hypothetical protein